jgi:phosphatidate cytidylyltransferase
VTTRATPVEPTRTGWRPSALAVRAASGLVLSGALVGLLLLGTYGVYAVTIVVGAFALWEFKGLSTRIGYGAPLWLLYPLGVCFAFSGTVLRHLPLEVVLSVALIGGLSAFLFLPSGKDGLGRWAMGLAGSLYIGFPLNAYLLLYTGAAWPRGLESVLLVVATVVVSDAGAYLVGRSLGRRPFFQEISPHKTVEGAVGGLILAVPVMLLGGVYLLGLGPATAAALGLLIGVAAVLGDLVESQMKRLAGVKDSSRLIPGHGGVLDRLDSLLFPPVAVVLFTSLLGIHL